MTDVLFIGTPSHTSGDLPRVGSARDYGVLIVDGPTKGITARAMLVLDENNTVLHAELVPEIRQEPDYEAALAALK